MRTLRAPRVWIRYLLGELLYQSSAKPPEVGHRDLERAWLGGGCCIEGQVVMDVQHAGWRLGVRGCGIYKAGRDRLRATRVIIVLRCLTSPGMWVRQVAGEERLHWWKSPMTKVVLKCKLVIMPVRRSIHGVRPFFYNRSTSLHHLNSIKSYEP